MRSPWLLFLWISPAFAAPCALDKPVSLKGKYPIRDAIALVDARFDRSPVFAATDAYRPERDRLTVELFDVKVDDRPAMRLGVSLGVQGKPFALGFAKNYDENTELVGACGLEDGNVVYANRLETKLPNGTAVTEVAASVNENGDLAMLRFRAPVLEPGKAWSGQHQDLCLKSAKLATR